jgi:nitroreductase
LQTLMLAARGVGLDTCPQVAFTRFPRTIARELAIPDERILVCGMALGYRDESAEVNLFPTPRQAVSGFATFFE